MLSIPLFEFQMIEEDFCVCANFMLIWEREKTKVLVDCLMKHKSTTKQDSLKPKTEYKFLHVYLLKLFNSGYIKNFKKLWNQVLYSLYENHKNICRMKIICTVNIRTHPIQFILRQPSYKDHFLVGRLNSKEKTNPKRYVYASQFQAKPRK